MYFPLDPLLPSDPEPVLGLSTSKPSSVCTRGGTQQGLSTCSYHTNGEEKYCILVDLLSMQSSPSHAGFCLGNMNLYLHFLWFLNIKMAQVVEIILVNTMVVDDMAMQGARASAAMVLTYLSWNILVSLPKGLNLPWGAQITLGKCILTHLPLVPHICISKSGQHWFR